MEIGYHVHAVSAGNRTADREPVLDLLSHRRHRSCCGKTGLAAAQDLYGSDAQDCQDRRRQEKLLFSALFLPGLLSSCSVHHLLQLPVKGRVLLRCFRGRLLLLRVLSFFPGHFRFLSGLRLPGYIHSLSLGQCFSFRFIHSVVVSHVCMSSHRAVLSFSLSVSASV